MTIIISKDGKNATKVEQSGFPQEGYLQKYIQDNPDSIPLYDIKEDVRLLLLREFRVGTGYIDALGFDNEGEIYLVETKLYRNQDKRKVIAQVLDYGASLWKNNNWEDFINALEENALKTFDMNLDAKLKNEFELNDEEVSTLKENMRNNLNHGNFKFVVLMDELYDELKDLIVFINQNSRFDIFAVEMKYYNYEDYEIIIPKLFGAEVKKDTTTAPKSKKWNPESFFTETRNRLTDEQYKAVEALYSFSKKRADKIKWGRGEDGSFNVVVSRINEKHSIYSVYTSGKLTLHFEWLHNLRFQEGLKQLLVEKGLFAFPANFDVFTKLDHNVPIEKWMDHHEEFQKIITELLE